jgi:hypothetical protein
VQRDVEDQANEHLSCGGHSSSTAHRYRTSAPATMSACCRSMRRWAADRTAAARYRNRRERPLLPLSACADGDVFICRTPLACHRGLLEIEVAHFVDAGEQGDDGLYDYYYEGDDYTFSHDARRLVLRTYVDDPSTAFFVGMTCKQVAESPLVVGAMRHLATLGTTRFLCLGESGTYESRPTGE